MSTADDLRAARALIDTPEIRDGHVYRWRWRDDARHTDGLRPVPAETWKAAETIAHQMHPRCTGGLAQGDDGIRYHSRSCVEATHVIVTALTAAEQRGAEKMRERCAETAKNLRWQPGPNANPERVKIIRDITNDFGAKIEAAIRNLEPTSK